MSLVKAQRKSFRGCGFDDEVVEFWIDLPSGRRLDLGFNTPSDYDTDEEVNKNGGGSGSLKAC